MACVLQYISANRKWGELVIGILLLTHEDFGAAMIKSAELIAGTAERCESLGLHRGEDIGAFSIKVKAAIERLDAGQGVLVFSDLFGASPYNAAALASQQIESRFNCISGLNLAMLLLAMTMRASCDLEGLARECMDGGRDSIKELFLEMRKI